MAEPDAYRDAGVDIDAGDALVRRIAPLARRTARPEVLAGLGGFGGLFALGQRYRDPVLVSGTDGVGTKLMVAERAGRFDTVGIDLVAMCVNDVLCAGAEPLFFLDYLATGKLDVDQAAAAVAGIAAGCELAGCALLGGETAEMPGMYAPGRLDLAGFVVGVVERDALMDSSRVQSGDALIGLPSSGLHSNGYSLARKLMLSDDEPDDALLDELLAPTRIYVKPVLAAMGRFDVRGVAHITGGGLLENVPRMLPSGLTARFDRSTWTEPLIFARLRAAADLSEREWYRTFNMGIGMVLAVPRNQAQAVADELDGHVIGEVLPGDAVELV